MKQIGPLSKEVPPPCDFPAGDHESVVARRGRAGRKVLIGGDDEVERSCGPASPHRMRRVCPGPDDDDVAVHGKADARR